MRHLRLATAFVVALPVAAAANDTPPHQSYGAHGLALPASFSGTLPCADCPGIHHQLDLWPEGGFALRRDYMDRDRIEDMLGHWHVDPGRNALVLTAPGMADAQLEWQILGNGNLRLLDTEGQPIESDLPYGLEAGVLDPFDLSMPLTGEFVYFADAALFTECFTGQRFPVLMEDAYIDAERAYLDARIAPMAPLMMSVEGRVAMAEQMEGPARRSLSISRLDHVTPGAACATARAPADLVNTYWRLMELDDHDLPAEPMRGEPYLLLLPGDEQRFAATVGCNRMLGGFDLDGDALEFDKMASTLMACPPELDALERAFQDALGAVVSQDSDGHVLRLRDSDGRVRARLAAVHTAFR
ncbi:MAG: META domain-containing protein [Roseinatronobacter sp.]